MVWGLTPHEIHSLVGCSADMEMYPFRVVDHSPQNTVCRVKQEVAYPSALHLLREQNAIPL